MEEDRKKEVTGRVKMMAQRKGKGRQMAGRKEREIRKGRKKDREYGGTGRFWRLYCR
jgi:hypothetical protein